MNPVLEYIEKKEALLVKRAGSVSENVDRKKRIRNLGFKNAKITKYDLDPEIAKDLLDLKLRFPIYKFITETELTDICKTWGLCWGNADLYSGELPEKNLKDIENFSLGLIFQSYESGDYGYDDYQDHYDLTWDFFSKRQRIKIEEGGSVTKGSIFDRREFRKPRFEFEIMAPQKDFIKGTFKKGVKIEPIIKDDPVVITQVRNGIYAIVTAWGPEAQDPRVFNEILN